jgi:hypothetical protein
MPRLPFAPYEVWMYRRGRIAGMHFVDVDRDTYRFVRSADLEPEGRRSGRRGHRLDRAVALQIESLWRELDEDGAPKRSLGEIADALNARDDAPARPGRAGQAWNPAAVSNALRTLRNQRLTLLRRLGSLLAVIAQADGVEPSEFRRLALDHQIEPYWVWDRLHGSSPPAFVDALKPPLGPLEGDIVVYPEGWRVVDLWRQLHEHEPEIQDVLDAMSRQDFVLSFEALYRVCERFGVPVERLIASDLIDLDKRTNRFRATETGRKVGHRWRLIASPDDARRWDHVYQPTPDELTSLPSDWDWDDRPIIWRPEFNDVT